MEQITDKDVDEKYILERCNDLLKESGIEKPPVNIRMLASFAGISEITEQDMSESGILYPRGTSDLVIFLRKSDNERRKNFTCAHEISHTFFPDYQKKPQKRTDVEVGRYERNNKLEFLCDFGASNLLLPDFLFLPEFQKVDFSCKSLLSLSELFETSLEATAIRMVSQKPDKYAVIVWEENIKPSEAYLEVQDSLPCFETIRPEKKLRVRFGYGFRKHGHIPKHKSLEEDAEVIQASYLCGEQKEGKAELTFGADFKIKCRINTFPMSKQGRILTLLEKVG